MPGWWDRASVRSRLTFAIVALVGWVAILALILPSPRGVDWLFVVVAPFYVGFFVWQLRRALNDLRRGRR